MKNKQRSKQKKKMKPSTVAPELVILDCMDCSFAHVLQTPNTQVYHSW